MNGVKLFSAIVIVALALAALPLVSEAQTTFPAVTSISPSAAISGSALVELFVNGYGFVAGSTVYYNGLPLSTTLVSYNQLIAWIPASYLVQPVQNVVYVWNPGGAVSNYLMFTVTPAAISTVPGLPNTGFAPAVVQGSGLNTTWIVLASTIAALALFSGLIVARHVAKTNAR